MPRVRTDRDLLLSALALPMKDFEDAVQVVSAQAELLDALVTRVIRPTTRALTFQSSRQPASLPNWPPIDRLSGVTCGASGLLSRGFLGSIPNGAR